MLLQLSALGTNYSIMSLTEGLCGVDNNQLIKEKEDGEQYIIPGLDRILALAVPEPKALVFAVANAPWLWKTEFTGPYSEMLRTHTEKRALSQDLASKTRYIASTPYLPFYAKVHVTTLCGWDAPRVQNSSSFYFALVLLGTIPTSIQQRPFQRNCIW